ncbi:hypothetical protein ES708_27006 [subsurface metagenome]
MGTDLTYEDMEPELIENFLYTMLPEETIDGNDCYVIEAVPADKEKQKTSGYSKRKLWVRKDIFLTVKIEYFDRRERILKTQTHLDFNNIGGDAWRAKKAVIDNTSKKHQTLTAIRTNEIDVDIDESVFTERYILSEKHIQ